MERVKSKLYNTARWKNKLRPLALARSYLCMYCFRETANQVDHLDGCPVNNSNENLIPVCHSCHSKKTQRVDVIVRLITIQTFRDALLFTARISKHCFDVPEDVLSNLTDEQQKLYTLFAQNSLYRPEDLAVPFEYTVTDLRYVVALVEVHRVNEFLQDRKRFR